MNKVIFLLILANVGIGSVWLGGSLGLTCSCYGAALVLIADQLCEAIRSRHGADK